jgi:mannonate dehydratase
MIESWRWNGDFDPISLDEVRQTGARSIVTALHEIPYGEVWPKDAIAARRRRSLRLALTGMWFRACLFMST